MVYIKAAKLDKGEKSEIPVRSRDSWKFFYINEFAWEYRG